MDQCVTWGCMGGLELHGQCPEAALGGAFKSLAVLQQCPVQMEADICLEALWETFQHLRRESEGKRKQREKKDQEGMMDKESGNKGRKIKKKEDRR